MDVTQPRPNVIPLRSVDEQQATRRLRQALSDIPLKDTLEQVVEFLKRYVVFSDAAEPIVTALWVAHTHTIDAFEFTPYLHVTSPEKRCGKSRLLDCLELVTLRPWRAISPTEAVLFRKVDHEHPTLLLDEVDALFANGSDDRREPIRAVLNGGYARGTPVPRCVGKDNNVQDFTVFCPKAFAGIGSLPDTISDRCLTIRLVRKSRDEPVQRFRKREAKGDAQTISMSLSVWAAKNIETLRAARPNLPEELNDRQWEICEPLLAIADTAGADWPKNARKALISVCTSEGEDDGLGTKLLTAIRDAFDDGEDRIPTKDLLDRLVAQETDAPWPHWWENDLRNGNTRGPAARLAHLLKPFRVKARVIRLSDGSTARGYMREDFEDAWSRYCPPAHPLDPLWNVTT